MCGRIKPSRGEQLGASEHLAYEVEIGDIFRRQLTDGNRLWLSGHNGIIMGKHLTGKRRC